MRGKEEIMDNPRKLALDSLIKADAVSSFSNLEINTVISRSDLSKKDAGLYTALYMGVTEKLITLDYVISIYSSVKIDKIDTETKNALRLGLYQLMFMDRIPEYSAVSETVDICPKRSKGFVNAVLRSFIRNEKNVDYPKDEWEGMSVISSTPSYIIDIFRSSYGDKEARALLEHVCEHTGISLRVNTVRTEIKKVLSILDERNIEYEIHPLAEDVITVYSPISDIEDIIKGGDVFVQDIASRLAVRILSPREGTAMLDTCACPGGKTFSSAIDMKNKGKILACDLHKNKLSLIEKGAKNLSLDIIETREQNGKVYCEELDSAFDTVLCDVPCSGLGVIWKKPDIKYKKAESVTSLPKVQMEILENCARYVKVGGELMYSTCTLNKAENEDVVATFLSSHSDFCAVDFSFGEIQSVNGAYTFMPHKTGSDGFFVAKMRRVK